jgi:palmitoyl-protein thioesterase
MAPLTLLLPLLATSLISASILPQHPLATKENNDTPLPLIIWHGLGDSFGNDGLKSVATLAEETNPGTFTHIIRLADDANGDGRASFFGNLTEQIDKVCADLSAIKILATAPAVDALGFSQGGVFLRGFIERCNFPPVRSLVTFGSPHNGISEFQACGANDWLCKGAQGLLKSNTWSDYVQSHFVPAQYYRDPAEYENYLESSNFLADVNNERELKDQSYKSNLEKLEKFVMYMFEDDTTVVPKESSWFAEVGEDGAVQDLRDRVLFKDDWLGLKALDKKGALEFKTTEGEHMSLSDELLTEVFKGYYGPMSRSFEKPADDLREDL